VLLETAGMSAKRIEVFAVPGIPVIDGPADIAELVVSALGQDKIHLKDGDVLVIAHTLVSKAEGRTMNQKDVQVSPRAKEIAERNGFDPVQAELALRESREVLRTERVLITETLYGLVCNFSGVDHSNAPAGGYVLLPLDPDGSASQIRELLLHKTGLRKLAVIISDTQGRPWRKGSVNLAIGCAGINAFKYNKGKTDLYGRVIERSTVCQIDKIAAAAEHVMGQAGEGTPVIVVRGYEYEEGDERGHSVPRPKSEDIFR
jgi:coenzyme F420-0:L-glutamate ligase/coenzyme F420-1:gamma-L-glutamate ligase